VLSFDPELVVSLSAIGPRRRGLMLKRVAVVYRKVAPLSSGFSPGPHDIFCARGIRTTLVMFGSALYLVFRLSDTAMAIRIWKRVLWYPKLLKPFEANTMEEGLVKHKHKDDR
jgi:hypothetical protein